MRGSDRRGRRYDSLWGSQSRSISVELPRPIRQPGTVELGRPPTNAATPSEDDKYCNTLYQFLDDAQWMSGGIATMRLGGGKDAWQADARTSLVFILRYGPPLEPLVPKDLRDEVKTVVDAATETGKLMAKDATASDVVDIWDRPKIAQAIKSLDDSRMHDEPCASTGPLSL